MKTKKQLTVNDLIDIENKIVMKLGYSGGGYYKDQEKNKSIYNVLKKKLQRLDLSWFKNSDYRYLENENYHSLNALIEDLKNEK